MGFVQDDDVKRLLQDEQLMSEIAQTVVEDSNVMDALVGDIASEIEGSLDEVPGFGKQIIQAAMTTPGFKKKLATKLAEELADD